MMTLATWFLIWSRWTIFLIRVDFPCPILVVQHMPPMFTRMLAERLSDRGQVPVEEAQEGSVVENGKGLIAPFKRYPGVARRCNSLILQGGTITLRCP